MKKRAILSVSDKTGIVDFARNLLELDYEVVATKSTYKALIDAGLSVMSVMQATGFPEILNGKVRTLHPVIHSGILCNRDDKGEMEEMAEHGITPIDLVCVDLYPFEETVKKTDDIKTIRDNIDVGGHSMLRAGAKNSQHVLVVSEISDYTKVIEFIKNKALSVLADDEEKHLRKELMLKAITRTRDYDTAIIDYFSSI